MCEQENDKMTIHQLNFCSRNSRQPNDIKLLKHATSILSNFDYISKNYGDWGPKFSVTNAINNEDVNVEWAGKRHD